MNGNNYSEWKVTLPLKPLSFPRDVNYFYLNHTASLIFVQTIKEWKWRGWREGVGVRVRRSIWVKWRHECKNAMSISWSNNGDNQLFDNNQATWPTMTLVILNEWFPHYMWQIAVTTMTMSLELEQLRNLNCTFKLALLLDLLLVI